MESLEWGDKSSLKFEIFGAPQLTIDGKHLIVHDAREVAVAVDAGLAMEIEVPTDLPNLSERLKSALLHPGHPALGPCLRERWIVLRSDALCVVLHASLWADDDPYSRVRVVSYNAPRALYDSICRLFDWSPTPDYVTLRAETLVDLMTHRVLIDERVREDLGDDDDRRAHWGNWSELDNVQIAKLPLWQLYRESSVLGMLTDNGVRCEELIKVAQRHFYRDDEPDRDWLPYHWRSELRLLFRTNHTNYWIAVDCNWHQSEYVNDAFTMMGAWLCEDPQGAIPNITVEAPGFRIDPESGHAARAERPERRFFRDWLC
jgi:hypothetical protein